MFRVVTTVLDDNNRRRLVVRAKYEKEEDARSAKDAMNKVAEAKGRVPSYAVADEDSYRLLKIIFRPKEKTDAINKRAKRQVSPSRLKSLG